MYIYILILNVVQQLFPDKDIKDHKMVVAQWENLRNEHPL